MFLTTLVLGLSVSEFKIVNSHFHLEVKRVLLEELELIIILLTTEGSLQFCSDIGLT